MVRYIRQQSTNTWEFPTGHINVLSDYYDFIKNSDDDPQQPKLYLPIDGSYVLNLAF